jgi:Kef-type K+ transport system membrane component KefB
VESNPVIQLFLALAIIIAAAKVCGRAARGMGQPRVFGELLAGVILGPTLLNFLHWPVFTDVHLGETIKEFAEFGVLLLMFNVGMDIHISELIRVGRVGVFGGIMGAIAPLVLTIPAVLLFDFSSDVGLFAGVALAATSVSISAQTLLELGLLQTKEGYALLAMALVDDVVAILLISFAVATTGSSSEGVQAGDLILIVIRMSAYIAGAGAVAWFVLPRIFDYLASHQETSQAFGRASFALIFALVFGWSAEFLGGVAAITGAFIAGAGISRVDPFTKMRIRESTLSIAYVFLMPIFFVSVGLETDLKQIFTTEAGQFTLSLLPFALTLLVIAVLSKIVGVFAGARMGGFTNGEAFRVGVCMVSRGEVGLIIAAIGLNSGIFTEEVFPAIFLVILVSTVLTPPLVRLVFRQDEDEESPQRETVRA